MQKIDMAQINANEFAKILQYLVRKNFIILPGSNIRQFNYGPYED